MDIKRPEILNIENAQLIYRNFSGVETKYNRDGNRVFSILIEDEPLALELRDKGWNVKLLKPREGFEDENNKYRLEVTVSYKLQNKLPIVKQYTDKSKKMTLLTERTVGGLDGATILQADVIINPSIWEVNGKTGIKAYLDTLYVVVQENQFDHKYADFEDASAPPTSSVPWE